MDLAAYLQTSAVLQRGGQASLAAPTLHLATLDQATTSWCRDWRAEIRMHDLHAPEAAPVTVGAVDFIVVQLSDSYHLPRLSGRPHPPAVRPRDPR